MMQPRSPDLIPNGIDASGALRDPTDELAAALGFSPLDLAASMTDDPERQGAIGLGLHMINSAHRRSLLRETGDSMFDDDVGRYGRILAHLGFEPVMERTFTRTARGRDRSEALQVVMARRDGVILQYDTIPGRDGTVVNAADIHFVWRSAGDTFRSPPGSGGRFMPFDGEGQNEYREDDAERFVYVGSRDVREAVVHKLREMETSGRFVAPWHPALLARGVSIGFLLVSQDYRNSEAGVADELERLRRLTASRVAGLPDWVREMIGAV